MVFNEGILLTEATNELDVSVPAMLRCSKMIHKPELEVKPDVKISCIAL